MATHAPVQHESNSSFVRTTKDGRQIRYNLSVIQQPIRARACGSGAKSSADRRPVDPPPIVELRVFENDQEVTCAYNANFFLHASLEVARTIADGRGSTGAPSFPVLTGTPVAGMAYLDRPAPAGYFIFPDLSVRHEGKYRLSFSLFENLSEAKDLDPEDPDVIFDGNHFVTYRAEVKSTPFAVFSAKKFPGLTESTSLSRLVAEQGCRVRIRRDVRMRRRENKSSKDWDEYEDGEYDKPRRTATPDNYDDRPRSMSNASNASLAPHRRPSMEEVAPYQASYQQMPPPQNTSYQYNGQYPYAAAPVMQPPQVPYQPAHSAFQSPPNPPAHYSYPSYSQSAHYEPRQEPEYVQPQPAEYRRTSVTQPYAPPVTYADYRPTQTSPAAMSPSHTLQNIKTLAPQPVEKAEPNSPMYHSPPSAMSSTMSVHSDSSNSSYPPSKTNAQGMPTLAAHAGQKRSFSSTFDTRHVTERLTQGARPQPTGAGYGYDSPDSPDMEETMDRSAMSYRRADGTQRQRHVPAVGM